MKTKKFLLLLLVPAALTLLSGCGSKPHEDPQAVLQKFKDASAEIKSGDLSAAVTIKGADTQDNLNLKGQLDLKFDRQKDADKKAEVGLTLSGGLKSADKSLSGNLAFVFRSLGNQFYLKLGKLESDDPSLKTFAPVIALYQGKWLKLQQDLIPDSVKKLQEKDPATLKKEEDLKTLFKSSNLLSISKEFGVENVNGKDAYHYGVTFNEAGLKDYLQKAAALNGGQPMSDQDLEQALKLAQSVSTAEMWIGTSDYYLYKGHLVLNPPKSESGVEMNVAVDLDAHSYNKTVSIDTPADAQEFNPLSLFQFNPAGTLGAQK